MKVQTLRRPLVCACFHSWAGHARGLRALRLAVLHATAAGNQVLRPVSLRRVTWGVTQAGLGTLWRRTDGAMTNLRDPDQSRHDESPAYEHFRDRLAQYGSAVGWQTTCNAAANPITTRLRSADLANTEVQSLLRATYSAVQPGASAWSQLRVPASSQPMSTEPVISTTSVPQNPQAQLTSRC